MSEQKRIYVLEDAQGNTITDDQLTPDMIDKLETRGMTLTIYVPYRKLREDYSND